MLYDIVSNITSNVQQLVFRHQKFWQYFSESFAKISTLKIGSFRNYVTILRNFGKNCDLNFFDKNQKYWKILKKLVEILYNFSTKFLRGREIAQGGGEVLPKVSPKVSPKVCDNFPSSKFHQNCNTSNNTTHNIIKSM